jgi:hypothetical protein
VRQSAKALQVQKLGLRPSAKALQVQKLALRPSTKTSAKTLICPARCFDL